MGSGAPSQHPAQAEHQILLLVRAAGMLVVQTVVLGLLLFLSAGTLAWERGWLFLAVFLAVTSVIILYIWRTNPDLIGARSRVRFEKRWDFFVGSTAIAGLVAIFPVAALDDGRFHWHPEPWWVCGVGYALLLVSMGVLTWVGAVNKFAEPAVRIQTERGHKVIDTGPYAAVRHPSYVTAVFFFSGIALSLGSLWALVPAGVATLALLVRTAWEDQTLQAELPGYKEYAQRVRYKWVPGVW